MPNLVYVGEGVADHAFLGYDVFALIFLVSDLDFGLVGRNFGGEIFGLDEDVVEFDLFVAVLELFLEFGGADADAVGDELAKFFDAESTTLASNGYMPNLMVAQALTGTVIWKRPCTSAA